MIELSATQSLTNLLNNFLTESSPARSFNSSFTPSTDKWTYVLYSVRIQGSATINLAGTSSVAGRIELQVGGTMKCQARQALTLSGTVVIGVGITVTNPVDNILVAWVPPNTSVQLVTANESGTPTYTLVKVTEYTLG